jgi:hypothetical protein
VFLLESGDNNLDWYFTHWYFFLSSVISCCSGSVLSPEPCQAIDE